MSSNIPSTGSVSDMSIEDLRTMVDTVSWVEFAWKHHTAKFVPETRQTVSSEQAIDIPPPSASPFGASEEHRGISTPDPA